MAHRAIVISRRGDALRRRRIEKIMPRFLSWSFMDATDGHDPASIRAEYKALLPELFWGKPHIKPGAFGCFVSHFRAWEQCAARGEPLLVLEDDVVFGDGVAMADKLLSDAARFDVTFLNRAAVSWLHLDMAYRMIPVKAIATRLAYRLRPKASVHDLRDVVFRLSRANLVPPSDDALATDAYLITPAGARKLISAARGIGARIGVDWFILGAALACEMPAINWSMPAQAAGYFRQTEPISAGVSARFLTRQQDADVGGSALNHKSMVSIAEYAARF